MKSSVLKRILAGALFALLAAGCSDVPVVQDVNQRQANEIVAVLHSNGILSRAEKQIGAGERYRVEVGSRNYSQAIGLLHERGLPGKPEAVFEDIISSSSFVPDSREIENLKLDRALALQSEEMLENHPAVASARAVVRYHFKSDAPRPSASVLLRTHPAAELSKENVFELIEKVLPGMEQDDIRIVLVSDHRAEQKGKQIGVLQEKGSAVAVPLTRFLFGLRVSSEDYRSLIFVVFGIVVVIGVAATLLGYWLAYAQFVRRQSGTSSFTPLPQDRGTMIGAGKRNFSELPEE